MTATFYVGDAIQVMNTLPEKSVDLVLTSPPFLALRSYLPAEHPDKALEGGSQSTPGEYVDWLLDVVETCARVLAPHGSLVFELGDTYAGSGGAGGDYLNAGLREDQPAFDGSASRGRQQDREYDGGASDRWDFAKPGTKSRSAAGAGWPLAKSLSLIPETFRFAMVYGRNPHTGRTTPPWRLRNVIRWVRPNPPVGALGDKFRPATSELMVFCKAKDRYFDLDAVREPFTGDGVAHGSPSPELGQTIRKASDALNTRAIEAGSRRMPVTMNTHAGAPPLDWWNIPPGGYVGAHYAVWPPELLIKPVKAMCPEKVCYSCNRPSRRILEHLGRERFRQAPTPDEFAVFMRAAMTEAGQTTEEVAAHLNVTPRMIDFYLGQPTTAQLPSLDRWQQLTEVLHFPRHLVESMEVVGREYDTPDRGNRQVKERLSGGALDGDPPKVVATGWSDCGHNTWRPGLILDPFGGSGTTALVATGHGRDCTLIDLDERNYELALDRVGPLVLTRAA